MATALVELDKSFKSELSRDYGTIEVRVVVLHKKVEAVTNDEDIPEDVEPEEVLPSETSKSPLANYLEDPKRGKECVVFLVNGQRQEAWDNTYIQRDLGFKYLRNRTMIVVDLDGLKPEALAEIMQGSREHFYPGTVYHSIVGRLSATLRKDPDLESLEAEAEREISELRAGDQAVKQALDQLIEAHHQQGDHLEEGAGESGPGGLGHGIPFHSSQQEVIVDPDSPLPGKVASGPYLISEPTSPTIRLRPDESVDISVRSYPPRISTTPDLFHAGIFPTTEGLAFSKTEKDGKLRISLKFEEPKDFEDDSYPIDANLRVTAFLDGYSEPRLLERKIVIAKPVKRPPRPAPILVDSPTFLKVSSRQPVRLVRGSADTHVRLRWDGKDLLTVGNPPDWTFTANCLSAPQVSPLTFSRPNLGRFELLIPTPDSLNAGDVIEFEVTAHGPAAQEMSIRFLGEVVDPPLPKDPRKTKLEVPEPSSRRRPAYLLKYINREQYETPFWSGDSAWSDNESGCFHEPTDAMPLVLVINEDYALLDDLRKQMSGGVKKLDASTIERRVTRYTSHIAFHLYQMYLNYRRQQEKNDPEVLPASMEQMRGEANRVAETLLKMMQVAG